MKILILAVDGLGAESLSALRLTKLQQRIGSALAGNPTIDNVVSRGWPEIYCGENAYRTGAFYQVPLCDGKRITPSQATGVACVQAHMAPDSLLWHALNQRGLSCGVFGLPTVSSVGPLNGFMVAATGAGRFGGGLGPADLYPAGLLRGLEVEDADLGLRMGYGAFIPRSIQELEQHANKHLADFFFLAPRLLERTDVETAIIGTRFVNELAYKFLGLLTEVHEGQFAADLKEAVLALAENFDTSLDRFLNDISPEHLFVVSDHGIAPFRTHVNLNALLERAGGYRLHRHRPTPPARFRPALRRRYRTLKGERLPPQFPRYPLEPSRAFSIGFTHTLYLNDERFTGTAMGPEQSRAESERIVEHLTQFCRTQGIDTVTGLEIVSQGGTTKPHDSTQRPIALPNIKVNLTAGSTNSGRTQGTVTEPTHAQFDANLFTRGFFGEYSGCKSEDTVACYQGPAASAVDLSDLTSIYRSILRIPDAAA
jgi:hypothetical protein